MRFLAASLCLLIVWNGCSTTRPLCGSAAGDIDWDCVKAEAVGKNVSLTFTNGNRVSGRLESIGPDAVLLKENLGKPSSRYPFADITDVNVIHTHPGRSLLLTAAVSATATFLFLWIMLAGEDWNN
ncbi:MAG: hypothetical protein JW958_11730 [Candidatus Eisenbacteria bacterium]|nr:hypothetical protein [Candidatus Eisenbacteria bacterium]